MNTFYPFSVAALCVVLAHMGCGHSVKQGSADLKKSVSDRNETASADDSSKEAHADHSPKHGGQFFMAPDGKHHLEGVMPSEKEFRIYFYDSFTKPINAKAYLEKSSLDLVQLDAEKREVGKPIRVPLDVGPADGYLQASIPKGMHFPLGFAARITFEPQDKPDLFNFTFEKVSTEHEHAH